MKKGKIKKTTTIEKDIHGMKACRRMALRLMRRERKLVKEKDRTAQKMGR